MPGAAPEGAATHWQIWLEADDSDAPALETVLARFGQSVARFEAKAEGEEGRHWRVQAVCDREPDIAEVAVLLAEAAGRQGMEMPDFHVEPIAETDWLALNRRQFPPVTAGRFFVHGSHFEGEPPAGRTAIRLDAGPAFGSGTHETTRGCLIAIDGLLDRGGLRTALDLGCGSGILSLALARAGVSVVASDVDPAAVETTRVNAEANGVAGRIRAVAAEGTAAPEIAAGAPYDLVVANILAEPLIALAPEIAKVLAPGGAAVLSGLLTRQEESVTAACRAAGLAHRRVIVLGEWSTLILER